MQIYPDTWYIISVEQEVISDTKCNLLNTLVNYQLSNNNLQLMIYPC